jgi:pheromone shutdown protein TraB
MSKKLTIIGTYHILSAKDRVKEEVVSRRPQVVAIELDQERYEEIVSGKPPSQFPGEINEIFAGLSGRRSRDDFRGAIEGAKETGAKIVLIDKNMREVMNEIFRILQEFNPEIKEERVVKALQEQAKINPDLYKKISSTASGVSDLPKIKEIVGVDSEKLNRFQKSLGPYAQKIEEIWGDRDKHMAQKIRELADVYDNIVAVVGAAHLPNLKNRLSDLNVELECMEIQ